MHETIARDVDFLDHAPIRIRVARLDERHQAAHRGRRERAGDEPALRGVRWNVGRGQHPETPL